MKSCSRFSRASAALAGLAALALACLSGRARAEEPAAPPFEPMKKSIDVGLVAGDEAKSAEFYGEVLGLKTAPPLPLPDGGKMLRFTIGTTTVKLLVLPSAAPKNPGGIQKAIGIRLLTMYFHDLDPIAERFAQHGLPKPQILGQGGGRLIFAFDPDGNQLELIQLPDGSEPKADDRTMIGLTVADVEKSREFYGKTLGLRALDPVRLFPNGGPMKYQFKLGDTGIKLWKFEGKDLPVQSGKYDAALGIRYFTFMVKDVDVAFEALKARGATIAQPPTDFGKLARVMFVADPDGNWIEFASPQKMAKKPAAP